MMEVVFVKLLEPPVTNEIHPLEAIWKIPQAELYCFNLYLALAVRPESDSWWGQEFSPHHAVRTAIDLTQSAWSWALFSWLKLAEPEVDR
jgi:hypothetical protein